MTSISKNMKNIYINNLDDIANKHKNTYHRAIKTKPVDVKSSTYIEFYKKNKKKDAKFKAGDQVIISKNKNIFTRDYVPNWSEEVFVITKVQILFRGHILLVILKMKKLLERFTKRNSKKRKKKNNNNLG